MSARALLWAAALCGLAGCAVDPNRPSQTQGAAAEMREARDAWGGHVEMGSVTPPKLVLRRDSPPWLLRQHGLAPAGRLALDTLLDLMLVDATWSLDPEARGDDPPEAREVSGAVLGNPGVFTVADALDALLAQLDWAYTVRDAHLTVTAEESDVLPLKSPLGTRSASLTLNSLNDVSSGAQGASVSLDGSALADLEAALGAIEERARRTAAAARSVDRKRFQFLFPEGSRSIVVRGSPSLVREARRLVARHNAAVARRAYVQIVLYEVRSDERSATRIDVDANLSRIWGAGREGLSFGPLAGAADAAAEGALTQAGEVSGLAAPSQYILTGTAERPSWSATVNGLLDALRTFSDAAIVSEFSLEVINGQVANIEDVRTRDYVAKITYPRRSDFTVPQSPEVEIKQVKEGVALSILPTLQDDEGHLQIALSLAELTALERVTIGEDFLTLPTISGPNHLISMNLASGEPKLATNIARRTVLDSATRIAGIGRWGRTGSKEGRVVETLMLLQMSIAGW